ncbi:hypothetical protein GF327_00730 [Candidatus Woesearchaeota archaeon]|nr:hypothetical protein [Candidatus Woesearchaeota archaeon]
MLQTSAVSLILNSLKKTSLSEYIKGILLARDVWRMHGFFGSIGTVRFLYRNLIVKI